jgi:hypothetical protein
MAGRNARNFIAAAVVVFAAVSGVALVVLTMRTPAPPPAPIAPKFPKEPEAHPVIPSPEEPSAPRAPPAFCEGRDIGMVATSLRAAHKQALAAAKRGDKKGAPAACNSAAGARELSAVLDSLMKRTGACVARDSALDGEWSQLESAVLAYGRCIDCTHPQADRLIGCQRILELVTSAEKSAP